VIPVVGAKLSSVRSVKEYLVLPVVISYMAPDVLSRQALFTIDENKSSHLIVQYYSLGLLTASTLP